MRTMRKSVFAAREIALFGIFGGLIFAAKMVFASIPNVEPVSLLVILLAICFGWRGLYAVYLYVLLEILFWGTGLWSLCYLYIWLILFVLARLLRKMTAPLGWAVLSGCFGLLFGALCALLYWVVGGWAFAVSWWISGIPMDLIHGTSNFILALVLIQPLRVGLTHLKERYGFTEKEKR